MIEIVTVWEIEGDFGNVGGGRTIGIFTTQAEALANAKDCGSLDGGGDGIVCLRHAVVKDGQYYLLQDNHPLTLGELGWSSAKDNHAEKNSKLALVRSKAKIPTMRVLRGKLNLSLRETKDVIDNLPHIFDLPDFARRNLKAALEEIGDIVEELIDADEDVQTRNL